MVLVLLMEQISIVIQIHLMQSLKLDPILVGAVVAVVTMAVFRLVLGLFLLFFSMIIIIVIIISITRIMLIMIRYSEGIPNERYR